MAAVEVLSDAEIQQIVAAEKILDAEDIQYMADPQNSCMMMFNGRLVDSTGATIPGLTVELSYRVPVAVDRCKYQFTLFSTGPGGDKRRVYQIEVVPHDQRSHVGSDEELYGPHQHHGERASAIDHDPARMGCRNPEWWFRMWLANANIQFGGRYFSPFEVGQGDLFRPWGHT